MKPSRSATTALHMYAPMFVVEVCTLRVPSALRMSDGSPDRSSVIATNDAHVFAAYSLSWRSLPPCPPPVAAACPAGTSTNAATSAATLLLRMNSP